MSPKDTDASANASTACRERSASTTQPSRSIERYLPFSAVKSEKQSAPLLPAWLRGQMAWGWVSGGLPGGQDGPAM